MYDISIRDQCNGNISANHCQYSRNLYYRANLLPLRRNLISSQQDNKSAKAYKRIAGNQRTMVFTGNILNWRLFSVWQIIQKNKTNMWWIKTYFYHRAPELHRLTSSMELTSAWDSLDFNTISGDNPNCIKEMDSVPFSKNDSRDTITLSTACQKIDRVSMNTSIDSGSATSLPLSGSWPLW